MIYIEICPDGLYIDSVETTTYIRIRRQCETQSTNRNIHRKQMVAFESYGRQRSTVRVHRGSWSRAAGRTAGAGRCGTRRHSAVAVSPEGLPGGGGDSGTRSSGKTSVPFGNRIYSLHTNDQQTLKILKYFAKNCITITSFDVFYMLMLLVNLLSLKWCLLRKQI